jgi:hypothetical protein
MMNRNEIEDLLHGFYGLEEGWNSYGAKKITERAIETARLITTPPDYIVPTVSGGVMMTWDWSTEDIESPFALFELTIHSDGEISADVEEA